MSGGSQLSGPFGGLTTEATSLSYDVLVAQVKSLEERLRRLEGQEDPHPQYLYASESDAIYASQAHVHDAVHYGTEHVSITAKVATTYLRGNDGSAVDVMSVSQTSEIIAVYHRSNGRTIGFDVIDYDDEPVLIPMPAFASLDVIQAESVCLHALDSHWY